MSNKMYVMNMGESRICIGTISATLKPQQVSTEAFSETLLDESKEIQKLLNLVPPRIVLVTPEEKAVMDGVKARATKPVVEPKVETTGGVAIRRRESASEEEIREAKELKEAFEGRLKSIEGELKAIAEFIKKDSEAKKPAPEEKEYKNTVSTSAPIPTEEEEVVEKVEEVEEVKEEVPVEEAPVVYSVGEEEVLSIEDAEKEEKALDTEESEEDKEARERKEKTEAMQKKINAQFAKEKNLSIEEVEEMEAKQEEDSSLVAAQNKINKQFRENQLAREKKDNAVKSPFVGAKDLSYKNMKPTQAVADLMSATELRKTKRINATRDIGLLRELVILDKDEKIRVLCKKRISKLEKENSGGEIAMDSARKIAGDIKNKKGE